LCSPYARLPLPSCYPPEYLIHIGFTDFTGPNRDAQAPAWQKAGQKGWSAGIHDA
jgi:hypothetical protein